MSQSIATPYLTANSYASLMAKNWGPASVPQTKALKNVNITGGQLVTLLNYSGGPGVITSMSQTLPQTGASTTSQNGYNGILSVYVDGEATPSLTYDVGGPLSWFCPNGGIDCTANMASIVYAAGTQFTARGSVIHNNFFPLPWHESILVTFLPQQTISGSTSFTTNYVTGVYFPFKLCSSVVTYDQSVTALGSIQFNEDGIYGGGAVQMLNVQGKSGHIVYHWQCWSSTNTTNYSQLETNVGLYLDGNPAAKSITQAVHGLNTVGGLPNVDSSGTEDWFRTAFYGMVGTATGLQGSLIMNYFANTVSPNRQTHFTVDLQELDGGIRFQSAAVLQMETGARGLADINNIVINAAFTPFWGVFYYIDYL